MPRYTFLKLTVAFVLLGCTVIRPVGASHGLPDNYVSDEVNVILAPGASIDTVNAHYGTTVREQIPGTTYYRLGRPGGADAFDVEGAMVGDNDLFSTNLNFTYEQGEIRQVSQAFLGQVSQA